MSQRDIDRILAGASALGVELPTEIGHKIYNYIELLIKWNRRIQLVATSDAAELIAHHVLDSLAVLPHLGEAVRAIDVGAGGGFPGAVIAIARPQLAITSLEPIHKKQAFLATARRELALDNYRPLPERDEQHRARPDFALYDVAVSRATFALPEWLERGRQLVRPGGRVLAMEGRDQQPLPPGASRHPYELAERTRAIIVRDVADTDPP